MENCKRHNVLEFWSLYNSSSKSILDVLETIYLRVKINVILFWLQGSKKKRRLLRLHRFLYLFQY